MSITARLTQPTTEPTFIRAPTATDAAAVHALIARCPPLDRNSLYCNLLQCTHFAATCALARRAGRAVGFVSGYCPPDAPDVLFVWQVAVDSTARGQGLAQRLIIDILGRAHCATVAHVHTTVTPSNRASRAMFERLADTLSTAIDVRPHFDRHLHLAGRNETEELLAIGPFDRSRIH